MNPPPSNAEATYYDDVLDTDPDMDLFIDSLVWEECDPAAETKPAQS